MNHKTSKSLKNKGHNMKLQSTLVLAGLFLTVQLVLGSIGNENLNKTTLQKENLDRKESANFSIHKEALAPDPSSLNRGLDTQNNSQSNSQIHQYPQTLTNEQIVKINQSNDLNVLLNQSKKDLEAISKSMSQEIIPQLKDWAFDNQKDLSTRWKALVLAAKIGGGSVNQAIQSASKSSEWYMRSAALAASSFVSENDAFQLARKLIKDKALVVRSAAVDVIGTSDLIQDRELLWKVINDPINKRKGQSLWIRPQALNILVNQPQRKEIPTLVKILKEEESEMRNIALKGLEKVSDFKFGNDDESFEDKRKRWLNWWEVNGRTRTL